MSIDKKLPQIRFNGFGAEWQKDKLGQLYNFQYGEFNNNPSNGGPYPVYGANGIIGGYTRFNAKSSAVIGHMGEYAGSVLWAEGEHFVTYNGTIAKPKKSDFNPLFGYFSLVKMNLKKICGGSGQPFLSYDALERLDFIFPAELEQTQIGNYFQKLDNLINQHQQKHDKLSSIKKAMLEKMFPKQGETVPEIRFKGFGGEWVEIGLLDSIERIIDFRGRTPKKLGLDWSTSGYRALSALNVKQGYIDFSIDSHFGDQELYDRWMTGSELHKDQVLFTTEAPMGNVAQVPNSDKYILSQRTIAFVVKNEVITEDFLATLLRSPKVFIGLSALSSGGTAKGVSQKNLANFNISLPKQLSEQSAIGSYFKKLDTLINQHQQQITKLNNIKQSCLSKMFV